MLVGGMNTPRVRLESAVATLLTMVLASCSTPAERPAQVERSKPAERSASAAPAVPGAVSITSATVDALVGKDCMDWAGEFDAGAVRAYALVEARISAPIAELIRDRCQTTSPAERWEDGVKLNGCARHDCADNRFDLLVSPSTGVSGLVMEDGRCKPINLTTDEALSLFGGRCS
jgi:hypothetical protein